MFRWSDLCSHIDLLRYVWLWSRWLSAAEVIVERAESWKMPADRLPAVGSTGLKNGGIRWHIRVSTIHHHSPESYTGFHGQMCFLFFLKLNSFSTLGIFFSLSPHFPSLSSSAQLFFISLFDQILISRHVKCIWPILISESSLPNHIP